ncbi:MAG: 4Fe-4S dicluster domain-containing protein [Spirochaetota bacterium]
MDRKSFFKKSLGKFLGTVVQDTKGVVDEIKDEFQKTETALEKVEKNLWETAQFPEVTKAKPIVKNLHFPPGASTSKREFKKTCSSCGDCINACPYNTIFPVYESHAGKSIPYMDVNHTACMLCDDWPCIQACSDDALQPFPKDESPNFGQARAVFQHCYNQESESTECSQCQDACPIAGVVSYRKGKPSFSRDCVGCGICVQACPSLPKAILIK